MTDHPAEAWGERHPPPAGVLALLILAGVSVWLGWYAYRGELGRLVSATPAFEVDMQAHNAAAANATAQLAETTPSVVIDLTPAPPAPTPAPTPPATPAPTPTPTIQATPGGASPATSAPAATPTTPIVGMDSPAIPQAEPLQSAAPPMPTTPTPSVAPAVMASAAPESPPAAAAPVNPTAGNPAPAGTAPVSPTTPGPTTPTPVTASEPQPEESTPALLAAIGPPPALVLHAMPPAAIQPAGGVAGQAPAKAGAGGAQQASLINAFLPQSSVGAPAWQRYARPFDNNDPRPRIAIVITKLGLLHGATLAAIDQLPADVTLSFSPYAIDLAQWIAHARSLGHEVMIDLPMESSQGGADPGPQGLLTSLSAGENLRRLGWVLGRANGYVGLAGVLGDRFTASPAGLRPVLREIAREGLMFLDPHPSAASIASLEATKLRLPRAIADLTIDDTPDRVAIDAQLAELEHRARITGFAIGLANGYPVTIERLSEWSRGLPDKNLALAPISAIADQQADR